MTRGLPRASWPPRSLRVRLLVFLLAAIALTALLQGVLAYRSALSEADALSDYHMQQTAFALRAGLPLGVAGLGLPGAARPQQENHEFIVQVWTNEGLRIFESAVGAALPRVAVLGFANVPAGGTTYRVFSLQTPAQVIQVAQDMAVRRAMARALALRSLLPLALMAPLLALAVWWTVTRQLAPLRRVRAQLAQRQADDLSPVSDARLPDEVRPLVGELNLLFARVHQAFEAQQHFVADAAHELRSPLAALKLQLQGLRRAPDAQAHERAVARLDAGIDRAARLVEQLLQLARQEASAATSPPAEAVDVLEAARLALADVAAAAQARGIALGLEPPSDAFHPVINGHADAIRILLRNLLDNAVKYTPAGGSVELSLGPVEQGVQLSLQDSGPGIAEAERERVLDRFYRTRDAAQNPSGSGLGLAIVQAIAGQHGATLELGRSQRLGGLQVRIVFPRRGPVAD